MLSVKNRFHGHNTVRRVYRLGNRYGSSLLSVHSNKGDKVRKTRVAVVVSKKVHKSAVQRNRIRRRLYEVIRLRLDKIKAPVELVVTVYRPDVADVSFVSLEETIDDLFEKAELY